MHLSSGWSYTQHAMQYQRHPSGGRRRQQASALPSCMQRSHAVPSAARPAQDSEEGHADQLAYGLAAMQGWRVSMVCAGRDGRLGGARQRRASWQGACPLDWAPGLPAPAVCSALQC